MRHLTVTLTLLILLLVYSGCNKLGLCKDEEITLQKTKNTNAMRLDGYWYGDIRLDDTPARATVYYLFSNGVVLDIGSEYLPDAELGNIHILPSESFRNARRRWGAYRIDGKTIEFEQWGPGGCSEIFFHKGELVSDSCFVLKHYYLDDKSKAEKEKEVDRKFYFKAAPKPDSTNNFIN